MAQDQLGQGLIRWDETQSRQEASSGCWATAPRMDRSPIHAISSAPATLSALLREICGQTSTSVVYKTESAFHKFTTINVRNDFRRAMPPEYHIIYPVLIRDVETQVHGSL